MIFTQHVITQHNNFHNIEIFGIENGNCLGKIEGVISFESMCNIESHVKYIKGVCNVIKLYVSLNSQHQGLATNMLTHLIDVCKLANIKKIELDDMSDNLNRRDNIYRNVGFDYYEIGFPEMVYEF